MPRNLDIRFVKHVNNGRQNMWYVMYSTGRTRDFYYDDGEENTDYNNTTPLPMTVRMWLLDAKISSSFNGVTTFVKG